MESAEPDTIDLLVAACDDIQRMDDTMDVGDLAREAADQMREADDSIGGLKRINESLVRELGEANARIHRLEIEARDARLALAVAETRVKMLEWYEKRYNGADGTFWTEREAEREAEQQARRDGGAA